MTPDISTVLARLPWSSDHRRQLEAIFHPADIIYADRKDDALINKALQTCDMAIIDGVMDDRYLDAPNLKWVHCDQSGLDGFAPQRLADSDLIVTSSKGRSGPVLAEHAVFFMLSLCYDAKRMLRSQSRRVWGIKGQENLRGLYGKKLCIVGYGATGSCLARQCASFGMEITAYRRKNVVCDDPNVKMYSAEAGDRLRDAIQDADYVAICASLNNDSYRMIGTGELAAMKPGGFLVNVARAQVVDETALISALKSGQLGGAGLDVTDPYEPLPPWHRLWSAPNVLITPHVTPQMPDRTARTLDILRVNRDLYLSGRPLNHQLTQADVFSCAPEKTLFRGYPRIMSLWERVGRRLS